ncbi:MAG: DUF4333 domain-containing protein [Thermoleophilaceae bacterium]|nr:DUF4333 domain-containing protein [Thermoleophilaceae bacterium]
MKIVTVLLTCMLLIALAGCSSEKTVTKGEVEKQAQQFFDGVAQKQGAASFPKVVCPDDVKAKTGEKTRCSAKGTDGTLGITVTVEKVDGDKATLRFKGDNAVKK